MATAQKSVEFCVEVDNLLGLVVSAVTDLKAGKTPAAIAVDLLPVLMKALSGLSELGPEVANKKALQTTVALNVADLLTALGL